MIKSIIITTTACAAIFLGTLTGLAIKEGREMPECQPPVIHQRDTY